MKLNEIKSVLDTVLINPQPVTPFLQGFPGIGKSAIVKQIADERNLDFIDVRLSQHDNTDMKGVPHVNEDTYTLDWITPSFLPFIGNPRFNNTKGGILFLDEINQASPDVLNSVFQIVYDKKIGEHEIYSNWFVVCAGNYGFEDGNEVTEFGTALKDRFLFLEVDKHNYDDFMTYAKNKKFHPSIISYIKKNPDMLYYTSRSNEQIKFVTPRRWEMLNNILSNNNDKDIMDVYTLIGESILFEKYTDFLQHLKQTMKITGKDILFNYKKVKKDVKELDRDIQYKIVDQIIGIIENKPKTIKDVCYDNINDFKEIIGNDLFIAFLSKLVNSEKAVYFYDQYADKYPDDQKKYIDLSIKSL